MRMTIVIVRDSHCVAMEAWLAKVCAFGVSRTFSCEQFGGESGHYASLVSRCKVDLGSEYAQKRSASSVVVRCVGEVETVRWAKQVRGEGWSSVGAAGPIWPSRHVVKLRWITAVGIIG